MSLSAVLVDIVVEGDVVLHSRRKWTMRLVTVQKVEKIDHVCVLIEQFENYFLSVFMLKKTLPM